MPHEQVQFAIPDACPKCQHALDGTTHVEGDHPDPRAGDLTICFYCGSFLTWDDRLKLKEITTEAFMALPAAYQETLQSVRNAIRGCDHVQ